MPRGIPPDVMDVVENEVIYPAFFCEFIFDDEEILLWTGNQEIDFRGKTYLGAGSVISLGGVTESKEIKAESLTFQLKSVPNGKISLAKEKNYQGRPCSMKMALGNEERGIINYPFTMFKGFMDVFKIKTGPETSILEVTAENRLKMLKNKNERRYTMEDQRFYYPDDMFFEFVNELQEKSIEFGPE